MNNEVGSTRCLLRTSSFNIHYSLFFSLLLSLLFTSCKDIRKEYYDDGTLKQQISYKKGVMDGPAVWYYSNGKKMMECSYVNGKIEGIMKHWFFNDNPQSVGFYKNNLQNGKSIRYFEDGGINFEENYKNDTLNGPFTEYYPDFQVKTKGSYYMGLWDGKWEYYDDKGLLVGVGIFVKGTGALKGFYWNGRLKRLVQYVNNQKDGTETWYKENGLIDKILHFRKDKLVGE
jgi:antitoxin component YwqK of YwqJK toxin-antitoxin module